MPICYLVQAKCAMQGIWSDTESHCHLPATFSLVSHCPENWDQIVRLQNHHLITEPFHKCHQLFCLDLEYIWYLQMRHDSGWKRIRKVVILTLRRYIIRNVLFCGRILTYYSKWTPEKQNFKMQLPFKSFIHALNKRDSGNRKISRFIHAYQPFQEALLCSIQA